MFKNDFFNRPWTDLEKWLLGIVAALLISLLMWGSKSISERYFNNPASADNSFKEQSILLGYNSALVLGLSNLGEKTTIQRAVIDELLKSLDFGDLSYPESPSEGSGAVAQNFVETVAGKLSVRNKDLANAFLFGWYGYINTNTRGVFPDFNIREAASQIGYRPPEKANDNEIYEFVLRSAQEPSE